MVNVLAATLETTESGGGSGSTIALLAVIALTAAFAFVQARRTTLRRERAKKGAADSDAPFDGEA